MHAHTAQIHGEAPTHPHSLPAFEYPPCPSLPGSKKGGPASFLPHSSLLPLSPAFTLFPSCWTPNSNGPSGGGVCGGGRGAWPAPVGLPRASRGGGGLLMAAKWLPVWSCRPVSCGVSAKYSHDYTHHQSILISLSISTSQFNTMASRYNPEHHSPYSLTSNFSTLTRSSDPLMTLNKKTNPL